MFQSTPSGGKATQARAARRADEEVSIHAFRGEGDLLGSVASPSGRRFNPRLPGGRRLSSTDSASSSQSFQSTPSGGKATGVRAYRDGLRSVSIHAFRGEGDRRARRNGRDRTRFQSTPSGGKATLII